MDSVGGAKKLLWASEWIEHQTKYTVQNIMNCTLDTWAVSVADFPAAGTPVEQMEFLLNYAVLAPSNHNTQPWLFEIHGEAIHLFADRTRALPMTDPEDRELIISCGAALFHLRVAMRHFGVLGPVETFPDPTKPDWLARLELGSGNENYPEETLLFHAIPKRRTNRQPFQDDPLPEPVLGALREVAQQEHAWLNYVQGDANRQVLAALIAEADCLQWADKRFRREVAAWVHPNRSVSHDGIPGSAAGLGNLVSLAGPSIIRTFNMGAGRAARDQEIALGSPVLALLQTDADVPPAWLAAGQALARVLLRARVEDVWASFLNQPIEVAELRPRICELVGKTGYPQILLRLGFGQTVPPTPRRPVDEVCHIRGEVS